MNDLTDAMRINPRCTSPTEVEFRVVMEKAQKAMEARWRRKRRAADQPDNAPPPQRQRWENNPGPPIAQPPVAAPAEAPAEPLAAAPAHPPATAPPPQDAWDHDFQLDLQEDDLLE